MLKHLLTAVTFAAAVFGSAQQAEDLLNIPGPVDFGGEELFLVWSKPVSQTFYKQQYLPADENFDNFTKMLDFSYFNKEIELELAVRQKVEQIQHRQETDKFAKVNVAENPAGNEFVVDYYISETPETGEPYMEYVIDRFRATNAPQGSNFLILSYVTRVYGEPRKIAKALAKQRDALIIKMIEFPIPEIKFKQIIN